MLNFKFWLLVGWFIIGIVNLCGKQISKFDYSLVWTLVIVSLLCNWLVSVGWV